jgi:phosphoglycerate dehydrogenase-like enzyme
MLEYAVILGTPLLSQRLFGARLEALDALDAVGAHRLAPPATSVTELAESGVLQRVEVLVTGWGTPVLQAADLDAMPRLRAIVHAGGVASTLLPPHTSRAVELSVAADANGVPVAEYTLAMILLANKQVFAASERYRSERALIDREVSYPHAGNFGQTVGIVGASRIGRRVIRLLEPFDLRVIVFDPYLDDHDARDLGVESVRLDQLLAESDVVSLHAPVTPQTTGMIGAAELAAMKDGATLLNTARGALVDLDALTEHLLRGRLWAVLDVTDPHEPLSPDSPLWDSPNVLLTPHVAGSMGTELRRLGDHVASELGRAAAGQAFATPERRPS